MRPMPLITGTDTYQSGTRRHFELRFDEDSCASAFCFHSFIPCFKNLTELRESCAWMIKVESVSISYATEVVKVNMSKLSERASWM